MRQRQKAGGGEQPGRTGELRRGREQTTDMHVGNSLVGLVSIRRFCREAVGWSRQATPQYPRLAFIGCRRRRRRSSRSWCPGCWRHRSCRPPSRRCRRGGGRRRSRRAGRRPAGRAHSTIAKYRVLMEPSSFGLNSCRGRAGIIAPLGGDRINSMSGHGAAFPCVVATPVGDRGGSAAPDPTTTRIGERFTSHRAAPPRPGGGQAAESGHEARRPRPEENGACTGTFVAFARRGDPDMTPSVRAACFSRGVAPCIGRFQRRRQRAADAPCWMPARRQRRPSPT